MSLLLKYNAFYLLAEITLKLGLQSTEEYFPYIAYAFFFFLLCKECSIKIHAANIEASKFFVFVFVGDHGKLFLKISQMQSSMYMLLLQLSYILRE